MKKNYTVYRHIAPNGKMYVGITSKNPKYRWDNGHGYASNKHFSRAIQKYGWDNIHHEILLEGLTKEQAECAEKIFIGYWNLTDPNLGYNHETGGMKNFSVSDETRKRLSLACAGKKNGMYGKRHTEESKRKMSVSTKKFLQKNGNPMRGRKHTEESRRKMSEAHKGKVLSEEHKRRMGESRRKPVCMIHSATGEIIRIFDSIKDASRQTGVSRSSIMLCCREQYKTAGGYKWKYVEKDLDT